MDENFEQNQEQNIGLGENEVHAQKAPVEYKPKKDFKKLIKDILYYACIVAIICIIIYMYIGSRPIKSEDVSCVYKEKQDKIVCTQTGEVVPEWLNIDLNSTGGLFGADNYSMLLIFSKDKEDYVSMNMKDAAFIAGMNRKFVFEMDEQTLSDYIRFKNYVKTGKKNNWGSAILYCSETNLSSSDVCKEAKRHYKK